MHVHTDVSRPPTEKHLQYATLIAALRCNDHKFVVDAVDLAHSGMEQQLKPFHAVWVQVGGKVNTRTDSKVHIRILGSSEVV